MTSTESPTDTTAAVDDGIPHFDLFDPALMADQYGFFAGLREKAPVWWVDLPNGARWLVPTRYEDIRAAHLDPLLRQKPAPEDDPVTDEDGGIWRVYNEHPVVTDPPQHTRLRKLVSSGFTARQTERLRPRVEQEADRLLAEVAAAGADGAPVDLMQLYAWPLPLTLICELLGVPESHRGVFTEWSDNIRGFTGGGEHEGLDDIAWRIIDVIRELVEVKRAEPADDLLSQLVEVGDEQGRMTEKELLSTGFILLMAGFETSVGLIGNGVYALLRHPDQLARVRADPALLDPAVDEVLRYDPSLFLTNVRTAYRDTTLAGIPVPKGQSVMLSLGAANRDPEKYPEPDRFDIGRSTAGHLAFGHGIHRCLGAPLAKVEGTVAIGRLLDRFPGLRLAGPEELQVVPNPISRTLAALPVVLGDPA